MESIAIIGMAGRFPKAKNVAEFWQNLCGAVEGIRFFSEAELLNAGLPADLVRRPDYVPAKGYLDDAEYFDASFFGYHPRDAEVIDPQQRLLLESAWSALEDAGYVPERFAGAIGVFVGVSMNTYLVNNLLANRELLATVGGYQVMISNDKDYAATRISYLLNLTGPSMGIQTACSTSLVAVERACQSLANHECDMALAGGASLAFPRRAGYVYQDGMILSPDGHCRVFDAQARGTVGGEGVGVVVLKRLGEALRDGDPVRAIIRGWATNNDGSAKVGFTAPAVDGQAAVIATAQAMAGINPRSITYVEAHGTGTELGDPVELAALSQVFSATSSDRGYCRIGSVKSNIGHLDAAAGIAGLIKATLALQHRCIPPTLHFQQPNPHIDFAGGPFRVATELFPWQTDQLPRRASVSSFGIGGSNAHLVLEEPSADDSPRLARKFQLLQFSAKSEAALDLAASNLAEFLHEHPGTELADVAFTLRMGRREFAHRRALVCQSSEDAIHILQSRDGSRLLSAFERLAEPQFAFLFPGQGAQYVGMGRGLYEDELCFREHFDLCAESLQPILGLDLRDIVFAQATGADGESSMLRNTSVAQPALFTLEYALARQLEEWGIRPTAMIGHSVGEFVAACLAGVFTIEEALRLVAQRGQLMQSADPGAMLAVPLSVSEVSELLSDDLSLAVSNAPRNSVVSGTLEAIARIEAFLQAQGFDTRRLHTSHAFHSAMMQPISERYRECVTRTTRRPPTIPFLSNLTGTWITAEQAVNPDYWVDHLLKTVRFSDGMSTLMLQPHQILLEVGPGQALSTLARQIAPQASQSVLLSSMRHPQDRKSDSEFLLQTLARIWLAGGRVDWNGFHAHERRRRVALPSYPFERKRYLVDPPKGGLAPSSAAATGRLSPSDWFYVPCWKQSVQAVPGPAASDGPLLPATWMLLLDECGVGAALHDQLLQTGQQVITVRQGSSFDAGPGNTFTVQPQRFGDYSALFDELRRRSLLPHRIVHLWNVSHNDALTFDEVQNRGFYSLLYLAQVLGRQPTANLVQMDVVSTHLQEVTGRENIVPAKATLRGPLLVIPQEYPQIILRSVDIEVAPESPPTGPSTEQLLQVLNRAVTSTEVALRDRYAWTRMHEPVHVPVPQQPSARLRKRGVYWIIGGLGQIGLVVAQELARAVQARIVLTGRSGLPSRNQWEALCDQRDPDEPEVQKCRKIIQLEALGAEVLVTQADVADLKQMRQVLGEIDRRFGELHGVIHSAGRVNGRIVHYLTPADCEAQFRPKVDGLRCLDELLANRPLDFCLINSSLSSVIGGMGFCAYAAANAYLDAFSQRKNREGRVPWFSVNWDGWRLGQPVDSKRDMVAPNLLSAADGQDAFARLLSMDWPDRVVVSTSDLQRRVDQWVARQPMRFEPDSPPEQKTALHPRPANLNAEFVGPRTDLEQAIAEVWQQLLGIDRIGIYDNYIELGGHSLLAGQLISRLREILKVPLSIRNLFESPTVAQFAAHVETQRWAMEGGRSPAAVAPEEHEEEIEL